MNASLELRHHLMMCFKEAVMNICKYSEAKQVHITLSLDHEFLRLRILDDGVGIQRSVVHQGNGLKNMERRMAKLQGRLTVYSESQQGTCIIFEIPRPLDGVGNEGQSQ